MEEPLGAYLEQFDRVQLIIEDLLEETIDLTLLDERTADILADPEKLDSFRYFAGPPISLDDLTVLADMPISPSRLRQSPELAERLMHIMKGVLDRRRFPWVAERREPTPAERDAAVIASSALMATQKVATFRRNDAKQQQEARVVNALRDHGLSAAQAPRGGIRTINDAPAPGAFCATEVLLGDRKADLVVRLWDGRIMPIECKVSNSSTNSVKRLNNDAAVKAETWLTDFGAKQVVPVAVLGGVYKLHNLENAQDRGLSLFWAHRLEELTAWIDSCKET